MLKPLVRYLDENGNYTEDAENLNNEAEHIITALFKKYAEKFSADEVSTILQSTVRTIAFLLEIKDDLIFDDEKDLEFYDHSES